MMQRWLRYTVGLILFIGSTNAVSQTQRDYYLQAGAFVQETHASQLAQRLHQLSQRPITIKTIQQKKQPLYLVQINQLESNAIANALQHQLKANGIEAQKKYRKRTQQPLTHAIPYRLAATKPLTPLRPASKPTTKPVVKKPKKTIRKRLWNLRNVDIRNVIAEVSRETGKNFIIDPRVEGKVSIISSTPMGPDEVYHVFLSVLQVSGFSALSTGKITKIVPDVESKAFAGHVANQDNPGEGDEIIVRVIPIKFVSAFQLVPILRPLMPQWASVTAYTPTNMLIVAGRANNIQRIVRIIQQVDTASYEGVSVFKLHYATASDVVKSLETLKRKGVGGQQFMVSADTRSNAVLISANKAQRLRLRVIIANLDIPNSMGHKTQIIQLRYLRARDLVPILAGIARSQFTGPVGTIIGTRTVETALKINPNDYSSNIQSPTIASYGGQTAASTTNAQAKTESRSGKPGVEIIGEPNTNSIIINAPPSIMQSLKRVIQRLDRRPVQVAVQALIVEINDDDIDTLGIKWGTVSPSGVTRPGTPEFQNGFAVLSENGFDEFQAHLSMLMTNKRANILSTPSLVVLNNHIAHIKVGQQLSVDTTTYPGSAGGTTTANPFTTVERQDAALVLNVTPQVNNLQSITLNIAQQNNSARDPDDKSGRPIFDISEISTSVIVSNGDVLVLGGLMRNQLERNEEKIPFLGHIPILGRIFRHNTQTKKKKKLMVFIRPIILNSTRSNNDYTMKEYDQARLEQLKQLTHYPNQPSTAKDHILPPVYHADIPAPFLTRPRIGKGGHLH